MSRLIAISDKTVDDLTAAFRRTIIAEMHLPDEQDQNPGSSRKPPKPFRRPPQPGKSTINHVRGTCTEFCPRREVLERTRNNLVHYFEKKNFPEQQKPPMVKCYARPAAGKLGLKPWELRTVSCLRETIEYLFREVLPDMLKPFPFVYDFIFDRLRAVRQDIIIQNFPPNLTAKLFEPIVMFLAYSGYKLCEEPFANFDPKICEHHLYECINKTLTCYDTVWHKGDIYQNDEFSLRRCAIIEAIYLLVNLGKEEALKRYITLPNELKFNQHLFLAYRMSLNYMLGNYYRCNRIMLELPHILCAVASMQLPLIRKQILYSFSIAYSSKNNPVSLAYIRQFTLHDDDDSLETDLQHYNIQIMSDNDKKYAQFLKTQFNANIAPPTPRKQSFVESKLSKIYNLNEVFHLRDLMPRNDSIKF